VEAPYNPRTYNISPRCVIKVIYFNFSFNFSFNSYHKIPVILVPLDHTSVMSLGHRGPYLYYHKLNKFSRKFLKTECYFSIISYKPEIYVSSDLILKNIIKYISYSHSTFDKKTETPSNATYTLILYYGDEPNFNYYKGRLPNYAHKVNLAMIRLSESSKHGYAVFCRSPSDTMVKAANIHDNTSKTFLSVSNVNEGFLDSCAKDYKYVSVGVYDYNDMTSDMKRYGPELEVIEYITRKVNLSLAFTSDYPRH